MKRCLMAMMLVGVVGIAACGSEAGTEPQLEEAKIEEAVFAPSLEVDLSRMEKRASGLYVGILVPAEEGADDARNVDVLTVHYVGYLVNGSKFDSSRDRGEPFQFQLGAQNVIPGWDEGLIGQEIGEIRRLIIPPSLAYGFNPVGSIPANSILIFDVELLGIQ